jgi:hypothetical protein
MLLQQYPCQFAPYLNYVAQYDDVRTYAEIGVAAGGTFIFTTEFLRQTASLQHSVGIDIAAMGKVLEQGTDDIGVGTDPFVGVLSAYINQSDGVADFFHGNAQQWSLASAWKTVDLVLIDGMHTYFGAKTDLLTMLPRRPKLIVFQ